MAKRRKLKKFATADRFIKLPHYMLNSAAWDALSGPAVKLFFAVWQRYNGLNNGEISYSVREAATIGLSPSAAARYFSELIEKGFLVVEQDSRFTIKSR